MVVWTRAAALRGYQALVDDLGGAGAALLERFDIAAEAVESHDAMVSSEAVGWALEIAAAELGCPDFGLRLAGRQLDTTSGPLAVAIAHATTVGAAVACASRFLFSHSVGVSLAVVPDPQGQPGTIAINYRDPAESNGFAQSIDLAAGTIHRTLRQAVGGDYGLRSVHLPHPPLAPAARYAEFFGAEVRFDATTTVLRVPEELLTRPTLAGDATKYAVALDFLTGTYSERDKTAAVRVRCAIDGLITHAKTDMAAVSRVLSVHERTLQRALAAEGTTFTAVLDAARRDITYRLLCETERPISEITSLIGLGEQSALTRATRRWFGATPLQIRRAAQARRGGPAPARLERRSAVSIVGKPA
ncbi:AraC family transcriptional regulator ligand-binding domain-containing protein [Nocardia brasiliensis]|uniref:AraC family transcriptional regulator n=1 Tax=Nocardia brasiliensis TaxID=37326 RepID=UPI003789054D